MGLELLDVMFRGICVGVAASITVGPVAVLCIQRTLSKSRRSGIVSGVGVACADTFMAMGLPELVLLGVGTKGETVKKLQAALGIAADGAFGKGTKAAVIAFQEKNGLDADGFAGPATLAKLSAFAGTVTEEHVAKSEAPAGTVPTGEALPTPAAEGAAAPAEPPPEKSVWATMKGWFG